MSDVSQAVEVAADAAVAVVQAEAAAEQRVEAAVAGAAAAVERAEETAEQIAAAAMESARGQEISSLKNEVASCRMELQGLKDQVSEMSNKILAQATAPPEVVVINPAPARSSSTPAASGETAQAVVETVTLDPASASEAAPLEPAPAPPRKKRHLF